MSFVFRYRQLSLLIAVVSVSLASLSFKATAQDPHGHAGDIEVAIEAGELILSTDLVEAEFGLAVPALGPNQFDDPGFLAEKEPPLGEPSVPDGALFGFDVGMMDFGGTRRSLWFWDGVGMPAFGMSPHELEIAHPGSAQSIQIDGSSISNGFFFTQSNDQAGVDELFDDHLLFSLVDSSGTDVALPTAGIYLFKTSHKAELNGNAFAGSPDLYWVAAVGVDEAIHEEAVDFVSEQFGLGIPEPTTAVLGLLASLGLCAVRRRS